jgi:hypothetical protein
MKDLNYWKNNAEEDYITTPISVLRYITELEKVKENKLLILYGVVKRLWAKLTIIIAYLPMLLIDYLISLTTDESYAEARKTTMTAIKRQWRL